MTMGIPLRQIPGAQFRFLLSNGATSALKTLLMDRHLYQSVEIERAEIDSIIAEQCENVDVPPPVPMSGGGGGMSYKDSVAALKAMKLQANKRELSELTGSLWIPKAEGLTVDRGTSKRVPATELEFTLPSIRLYCPRCKNEEPYNPGSGEEMGNVPAYVSRHGFGELHVLPYQCQGCKTAPVTFFVVRNGLKFRLVGRTPIESVNLPSVLPEPERKFFSDAVLAFHSGQILPAMFMLRTFIEQVWKRYNSHFGVVLAHGAITADERGGRYQDELPPDFKQRFPSLLKIYADLSAAMHDANADATIYGKAHAEIVEHFEARKVFKLEMPALTSDDHDL